VTVKCRTAIKVLLLYFNLHLSVEVDSLSCSFTTISFLTNCLSWSLLYYWYRYSAFKKKKRNALTLNL